MRSGNLALKKHGDYSLSITLVGGIISARDLAQDRVKGLDFFAVRCTLLLI